MTSIETGRVRRGRRGLGSIYQRARDGLWVATIDLGRQSTGRVRKSVSSKTFCGTLTKLRDLRKVYPQRELAQRETRSRGNDIFTARLLGTHTAGEWFAKVRACQRRCQYCGRECLGWMLEKDHVIPISRGGSDGIDNVVVACYPCNRGKSDMTVEEWRDLGSPIAVARNGRRIAGRCDFTDASGQCTFGRNHGADFHMTPGASRRRRT